MASSAELAYATPATEAPARPRPVLSVGDAVAVVVGVVIGAGIFRAPAAVAGNVDSTTMFMLAWLAGGVISLIGALCYAELATTYPDAGGDYHYLMRSLGEPPAFLFAWARLTVIQTGSIALQGFIIGDYASTLVNLGPYSSAVYAGIVVALLTALNMAGIRQGKWTQVVLTACVVLGLIMVMFGGVFGYEGAAPARAGDAAAGASGINWGLMGYAMVFVLLTYGGWNEAAYLSAEVRGDRRSILRVLLWGIGIITVIYLLVNAAYVYGLGLANLAESTAVAADLMRKVAGNAGANFISVLVVLAALSTINATIITGARTNYALGRDFTLFKWLGRWEGKADSPRNALVVQGVIALALVALGGYARGGFTTMVDYTAPVFWFFFLLVGLSVIILRYRDPGAARPFRVPLYPLTPILFCIVCVLMLYSSLNYTGIGALVGVAVLAVGLPALLVARYVQRPGRRSTEFNVTGNESFTTLPQGKDG